MSEALVEENMKRDVPMEKHRIYVQASRAGIIASELYALGIRETVVRGGEYSVNLRLHGLSTVSYKEATIPEDQISDVESLEGVLLVKPTTDNQFQVARAFQELRTLVQRNRQASFPAELAM